MITPQKLASVSVGTRLRSAILLGVAERYGVTQVCDAGCGAGILAGKLSERGMRVFGFDYHPALVVQASHHSSLSGRLFASDIFRIPARSGSLGGVVCADVIEHLSEPTPAFREIARVLKPEGLGLFTIPNPRFERLFSRFGVAQADIGHAKTYSPDELVCIAQEAGLRVVEHTTVCNLAAGVFDAAIARLAITVYGKGVVRSSAMALQASGVGIVAWTYYLISLLAYGPVCALEWLLPSRWGVENLFVVKRATHDRT